MYNEEKRKVAAIVILRKSIPFSVELSAEIRTLDMMTDKEFDEMMQTGLTQAKRGESIPYEDVFEQLMRGL